MHQGVMASSDSSLGEMPVPHHIIHFIQIHLMRTEIKTVRDCLLWDPMEKDHGEVIGCGKAYYYRGNLRVRAMSGFVICMNFPSIFFITDLNILRELT